MPSTATTVRSISVSQNPSRKLDSSPSESKPNHWADASGSSFINPWPSWRFTTKWERLKLIKDVWTVFKTPDAKRIEAEMPTRTPTWGYAPHDIASNDGTDKIRATWLGHACFFVEFPSRGRGPRGLRILFDPVFSNRCSPSQLVGPKRFTPPPCKIEDIPEMDAIVISHDHYDHLDTTTIQALANRPSAPHFFAGLGNAPYFKSLGIPESRTHIMDWWESKRFQIRLSSSADDDTSKASAGPSSHTIDITCTPAQHFSGRTFSAYYTTLWASWAVEEVVPAGEAEAKAPVKVFFGGDTGYRSVMDHQKEDEVPVCPAFKEIGDQFGGFDLALLPIGAYLPRQFMSPIHCAPQDSVRLFKDIQAKKAIGMHWGTWVLTPEDVLEPPKRLREECRKIGIHDDDFRVCGIGETLSF